MQANRMTLWTRQNYRSVAEAAWQSNSAQMLQGALLKLNLVFLTGIVLIGEVVYKLE